MSDIQRFEPCDECSCLDMAAKDGIYVRFADVEARLEAAEELADALQQVSGFLRLNGHPNDDGAVGALRQSDAALAAFRATEGEK